MNVDASMNEFAFVLLGPLCCFFSGEFCRGHQRFFFPLSESLRRDESRSALAASVVLSASDEKSFFTSHHHPLRLSFSTPPQIYTTESKCEKSSLCYYTVVVDQYWLCIRYYKVCGLTEQLNIRASEELVENMKVAFPPWISSSYTRLQQSWNMHE